jgi:hypothetical protein
MVLLAGGVDATESVDFLNGFNEAIDMPPLVQPVADNDVQPAKNATKAIRRVRRVTVTFSPLIYGERRSMLNPIHDYGAASKYRFGHSEWA